MSSDFGSALKSLRLDLGLSQLDLAHQIATTQRHLSFLETGRSRPSRDFLIRLSTGLSLSLPQRAALFEASEFRNPYKAPDAQATHVAEVLDVIDRRVLAHWPFAAFALDPDWTVLRMNRAGHSLLSGFLDRDDTPPTLLDLLLSARFREWVENWEELAPMLFFRLQAASLRSEKLARAFAEARQSGFFANVPTHLATLQEVPAYVPAQLRLPDGQRLRMSSMVGGLASIHDASVAGIEIELMIPMDDESEALMRAAGARDSQRV